MDAVQQAAVESVRRRVRRAEGLLRDAGRELAALASGQDVVGVHRAHDAQSIKAAHDLIALGAGRYGAVDVVVLARPTGRARHTPTTAAQTAKESNDGTKEHET